MAMRLFTASALCFASFAFALIVSLTARQSLQNAWMNHSTEPILHGAQERFQQPGFKFQVALAEIVGEALELFYTSSRTYEEGTICPKCISQELHMLITGVQNKASEYCSGEPDMVDGFCTLFSKFPNISALVTLTKLGIDPISLAGPRCVVAGPCKKKPNATAADPLAAVRKPEIRSFVFGHAYYASLDPGRDPSEQQTSHSGGPKCEDCLERGLKLMLDKLEKGFHKICDAPSKGPPPVKAACDFAKKFPYLAKTTMLVQLKPWNFVLCNCALRGPCGPPPPPLPPPRDGESIQPDKPVAEEDGSGTETLTNVIGSFLLMDPPFGPESGLQPPPCPPGLPFPPPPRPPIVCFLTLGFICPPPPPPPPPPPCLPFPPPFPPLFPPPFGPHPEPPPKHLGLSLRLSRTWLTVETLKEGKEGGGGGLTSDDVLLDPYEDGLLSEGLLSDKVACEGKDEDSSADSLQ